MYFYKAFNLDIASELEIPEFLDGNGEPDILIKFGHVQDHLDNPLEKGLRYQIARGEFLLHVDQIARFKVEEGERITIKPFDGATPDDIRLFLLGSVFGALFHQRNLLPIHASSACFDKKAILFSGASGAGKSTLAAAFSNRGYSTISDDISLIVPDQGNGAILVPGYPQIKLWQDSFVLLNRDYSGLERVREQLNKYKLSIRSDFCNAKPLKVKTIYLMETKPTEGIEITPLKGYHKFDELTDYVFRQKWAGALNCRTTFFSLLSTLLSSCEVKKIRRQKNVDCLHDLVNLIVEDQQNG